jgi:hypothetical protein
MNAVQKNVLKSLRDRVELATKKIELDRQDILYQEQIIAESKELIKKLQEEKGEKSVV